MIHRDDEYNYQRFQQRGGSAFGGTPWGALILAAVVLGLLAMALSESKTGAPSPTLDKVDACCRVLSGDKGDPK